MLYMQAMPLLAIVNMASKEIRDIGGKRLFLHASDLKVTLPDGEVLAIHAEPGEEWQAVIEELVGG